VSADKVIPDRCSQDPDHSETLTCDAALFINGDAGVRIGNFATDIAVQDFTGGNLRVLVPTRGDPSISWADYNGETLSCVKGDERFALCDDTHRLTTVRNDAALGSIPNEPFSVFADSANGFAIVTHQSAGAVTLIDSRAGADAQVVDIKAGLFAQDASTGIRSATGVAGRSPNGANDIIYVGSRSEDRIQTFTVGRFGSDAFLLASNYFFLDAVGANTGGSSDTRGLQFSPAGARMYVVNRNPPSLQIYDTSETATGVPANVATGASDICREASTVSVLAGNQDTSTVDNGGERAYVTCFQDGQVYVVDPHGQSRVEDIITVGRGPYGIVAATGANPAANMQKQLFISNFLEDTIAVVDVTPGSKTRNRVVLRIGIPRAP
jgi:DNA-binding beta-propeller fold protein YncE